MPDIRLKHQPFDITFHPSEPIVYVGLLTGQVDAFKYSADKPDTEFEYLQLFSLRPTKRSCRGLATNFSGDKLYSVTKGKAIFTIDTATGQVLETTGNAHESPINRVTLTFPNILATGDDEGVVKLWDERKKDEIRAYTHHFDFISDFLWLEDKRQLVATSGDGTLSVMDIRSNKGGPLVQSEDQDDELLSIAAIKNNMKAVVGTQLGNISIFNRNIGWGDCVDRIPGHPHSVETIYTLPPNLCPGTDIIATGSSDGMVRLVQILPTKVLGVIADHEEFPVERIKGDMRGANATTASRWIGSISHEKVLRLTDIGDALEESDNEDGGGELENEDGDAVGGGKDLDGEPSDEEEQTFVGWGTPAIPKAPLRTTLTKKAATTSSTAVATTNDAKVTPASTKPVSHARKASEVYLDEEEVEKKHDEDVSKGLSRKKKRKLDGKGKSAVVGDFSDL